MSTNTPFISEYHAFLVTPRFTLFCREIRFFLNYALLGVKFWAKKYCPCNKNDKYEVWPDHQCPSKNMIVMMMVLSVMIICTVVSRVPKPTKSTPVFRTTCLLDISKKVFFLASRSVASRSCQCILCHCHCHKSQFSKQVNVHTRGWALPFMGNPQKGLPTWFPTQLENELSSFQVFSASEN